uniref:Mediator of RNA polymerase II transcription subunit 4 n=1 Tax=Rhabditophanes sp. KR3021 TaxID=114890 RepID=A0AC35TK82_9BILA
MSDFRTLREEIFSYYYDIECICQLLLNNLNTSGKKVKNNEETETFFDLSELFVIKEEEFFEALEKVESHCIRENEMRRVKTEVDTYDEIIQEMQTKFNEIGGNLVNSVAQSHKKVDNFEKLIENAIDLGDTIQAAKAIALIDGVTQGWAWMQGDPGRPYPIAAVIAASGFANPVDFEVDDEPDFINVKEKSKTPEEENQNKDIVPEDEDKSEKAGAEPSIKISSQALKSLNIQSGPNVFTIEEMSSDSESDNGD